MKALILAAGYATRLKPLTDRIAKPLLPIGGEPVITHLYRKIVEAGGIDEAHVVTNHRFAPAFHDWAKAQSGKVPIVVHDDGSTTNDDRLGAIGDISFTVKRAGGIDDWCVLAGDNLFDYSVGDLLSFFGGKPGASVITLYTCPDPNLVRKYSVVGIDATGRVVSFVEKPASPESNLVGTAAYVYRREHIALIDTYLAEGNSPDQPGNFVAWLHRRVPVYGFTFEGRWIDIGSHSEVLEADNWMRKKVGLPERAEYSPDT